ncbi:hypothetical protein [Serratia marcescens]|uniref:hypothetical protein n=1 Tax=Serratia marcescens TaxID=615 RepID=UPI003204666D
MPINNAVSTLLWLGRFESQPIVFDTEDRNPEHQFKHRVNKLYDGICGNKQLLSPVKGSCVFIAGNTKVFIEIPLPPNTEEPQNALIINALLKNTDSNDEFCSTRPTLHEINAALKSPPQ